MLTYAYHEQIVISAIVCLPLALYLSHWYELNSTHWIIVQVLVGVMILQLISIGMQPTSKTPVAFKVKHHLIIIIKIVLLYNYFS